MNPRLWKKIQQLDVSLIIERMVFKYKWSKKRVQKAISDYRQFLYLTQVFELPLSPTNDVDIIWHDHILHTAKYAADCDKLFDTFLHHYPIPINLLHGQLCGVGSDESEKSKTIKSFCGVEGDGPPKKPVKEKNLHRNLFPNQNPKNQRQNLQTLLKFSHGSFC